MRSDGFLLVFVLINFCERIVSVCVSGVCITNSIGAIVLKLTL